MKNFMNKVGNFFKKVGKAIADGCKKAWKYIKNIPWNKPVKPLVAWCVVGGTVVVSVALMLIFWLTE